jgi:hypothetical protein
MDIYHDSHIQEEMLERYALNQLPEEQLAPLEEHLLGCPTCQNRLDQVDAYVQTMKSALKDTQQSTEFFRQPGVALVGAGALAVMGAILILPIRRSRLPAVDVRLIATRGADTLPMAHARSGAPLILHIDVSEIARPGGYGVELVDTKGVRIWHGPANSQANELSVEVGGDVRPGIYWVRLYDNSNPPALIREYGLELN